ncbi:MAG: hypothetical protein SV775_10850, partial [Thermodesulfobacteriota bacterium]|nr:hypothetical protein [Thermodesulfobacteriota bacterium]
MKTKKRNLLSFTLANLLFFCPLCNEGMADGDWALTLYSARISGDSLKDTFIMSSSYDHSYLLALALSKRVASSWKRIDWEYEGQIVKHYGDQSHMEFNCLIAARYPVLRLKNYIRTSFAVGEGISYATETPKVETDHYDKTSNLLNYLLFELAFGLPKVP